MKESKYRWVICAAGTLTLFCTGGLLVTGFNAYSPYLLSEGGLSNPQLSVVLMMRNLFALLAMLVVIPFIRKFDVRNGVLIAMLIGAASLGLFSISHTFIMFCIAMGAAGVSYGLGGMVMISVLIKRWFPTGEGAALGLCAASTGLSSIIAAPLITAVVEKKSMHESFLLESIFVSAVAILTFLLIRNYPSREKEREVAKAREQKAAKKERREIFQVTGRQKMILLAGVILSGASYNVSPLLTVILREKGFDAGQTAALLSFMGIALCLGKMIYGVAADRWGGLRAGTLFHTLFIAAIFLCALIPDIAWMGYLSMLLLGLGFPMLSVGLSELATGTAHKQYYADAVRTFNVTYMIGSVSFGLLPGVLADYTGSYTIPFLILGFAALIAALFQQSVLYRCTAK